MAEPPTGTVTFLFTDIEGSTRLLRELGDSYGEALAAHRQTIRQSLDAHGGVEVDTQGDAFFYAFSSAVDALAAARAAQAALAGGPIRVRMGLHTGTPSRTAEGYFGLDIHLGARVAAAGWGGQVLLTRATRDLVDGDLRDLGEHRVKDFAEPVWIYQLGHESFPPLKTLSNTNLPHPASSFVGRGREVAELATLLRDARLVTLTGPGGSGKTRLAIEAASELVGEVLHGVFWVGLATVRDPDLVEPTIARALGAQAELSLHVGEKEMLLLLDNLEQVIDSAPILAALVEACPNLTLLVTSRELLRVRGEVEYQVLPLAEPDAVELFCTRAQVEPSAAVEELCRRLDDMPLALELAAARTRALAPEQILDRLKDRLDLFKGGRDADDRQRTLRATIKWSHDLLNPGEEQLFARLGVFLGGCTLEAVRGIADADVDTLQSLVEKSLVRHTGERFWMLETIREYAAERLGDAPELRQRFARFYLDLADSAALNTEGREQGALDRSDLVVPEEANIRGAIDGALTDGNVELAAELMHATELFWATRYPFEGVARAREVLDAGPLPPLLRARMIRCVGSCADLIGQRPLARETYEEAIEIFREIGDEAAVAHLTMRLGSSAGARGDNELARRLLGEAIEASRRLGLRVTEGQAIGLLGHVDCNEGNRELGLRRMEESATMSHDMGFTWWETNMVSGLAEEMLDAGRLDDSERWGRRCLGLAAEVGSRANTLWGLGHLAAIATARGDDERAGRLWGSTEAEEARGAVGEWDRSRLEGLVVRAESDAFERGRAAGRLLSLDEAVDYSLSDA